MRGEDALSPIEKLRTRDRFGRPSRSTKTGNGSYRPAGFDQYRSKPVDPIVLLDTVAQMVRRG